MVLLVLQRARDAHLGNLRLLMAASRANFAHRGITRPKQELVRARRVLLASRRP